MVGGKTEHTYHKKSFGTWRSVAMQMSALLVIHFFDLQLCQQQGAQHPLHVQTDLREWRSVAMLMSALLVIHFFDLQLCQQQGAQHFLHVQTDLRE
uniref:Uncharacterized protein n=1 Tax=Romanomermis culicivorax TaxID=13658 RepID=A0A915JJZ5_ROMCU